MGKSNVLYFIWILFVIFNKCCSDEKTCYPKTLAVPSLTQVFPKDASHKQIYFAGYIKNTKLVVHRFRFPLCINYFCFASKVSSFVSVKALGD